MNVHALAGVLWRRKWLALAVLVFEAAAVVLAITLAPKKYTATATIAAAPQPSLLQSTGNFEELENTLGQIVNSRAVLEDVASRLSEPRSVNELRDEVSGARVGGTVLVRITVSDRDPRAAAEIANAITEVLPLHDPSGGLFRFTNTDRANTPSTYSSPDVKVVALVGTLLGIVLAAGSALIRDSVARTVENAEQLRDATAAGVLGTVPRPSDLATLPAVDAETPNSTVFRALRVALEFAGSEESTHSLVIAAVVREDADAWLATNLAVALAQVHHRVLLIDGDLGAGEPHPALAVDGAPGLYDVLRRTVPLDDALRPGPAPGVTILPAGRCAGEPTANLIELHFHDLLVQVAPQFDVVLALARPVTESDDARVMAVGAGLLLVVPSRKVKLRTLRELSAGLRDVRIRLVGSILIDTRVRVRGRG